MVTDIGVAAVLEGCSLLRHTNLYSKWTGSDDLRAEQATRCPNFYLALGGWEQVSASLAHRIPAESPAGAVCPTLSVAGKYYTDRWYYAVHFSGCYTRHPAQHQQASQTRPSGLRACVLRAEVVLAVAQHCPLLVAFSSPPNVGDVLARLAEGCPRLVSLGLVKVSFTDIVLIALAARCRRST
jgi:hypothetical protein